MRNQFPISATKATNISITGQGVIDVRVAKPGARLEKKSSSKASGKNGPICKVSVESEDVQHRGVLPLNNMAGTN